MKKVILLIVLAAAGIGGYYSYNSSFVKDFMKGVRQGIEEAEEEEANKNRSKTPKTLMPGEFAYLDSFAINTPKEVATSINALAKYLVKPAKNDREKARVLFTWVATHIKYDDEGYNKHEYGSADASDVLQSGRSVCGGYGNLLEGLCKAAGLEAVKISGYSKGYGYNPDSAFGEPDHAWNTIKIDGKWRLFDATWAAGYGETVDGGMKAITRFDPWWFDVDPAAFIFTHLPEQEKWQLIDSTITMEQYQLLPWLRDAFFKLGFDPAKVFAEAVAGKPRDYYAEAYNLKFPLKVLTGPYTRTLIRGEKVSFSIQSDYAEKIMLIDGEDWTKFKKSGNIYTLDHQPVSDSVSIVVKIDWYDKIYNSVLRYAVTNPAVVAAR